MVLDEIIAHKKVEILAQKEKESETMIRERAMKRREILSITDALKKPGFIQLIAEIKKASPSAGLIRSDFDPEAISLQYVRGGAAALSVLTDAKYFQGSLDVLSRVRSQVRVPLLRKDFLLEPYQIWEARASGADAVLLIARILEEARLKEMIKTVLEAGLSALVEVHHADELKRALDAGAEMIGINNRDLDSLTVDLKTVEKLAPLVPNGKIVVAESGYQKNEDIQKLDPRCVHAVLVGEFLMKQGDIQRATAAFMEMLRVRTA